MVSLPHFLSDFLLPTLHQTSNKEESNLKCVERVDLSHTRFTFAAFPEVHESRFMLLRLLKKATAAFRESNVKLSVFL